MKKYKDKSRWIFLGALIAATVFFVLALVVVKIKGDNVSFIAGIISGGIIVSLFSFPLILLFLLTPLTITENEIIFNYAFVRKTDEVKQFYNRKLGWVIKFDDIGYIKKETHLGDGFFTKDTDFYLFHLKNGGEFEVELNRFSKSDKKEIIAFLNSKARFSVYR